MAWYEDRISKQTKEENREDNVMLVILITLGVIMLFVSAFLKDK